MSEPNEYDGLLKQGEPQKPANEYDGIVVDMAKEREQRTRASLLSAQTANPDATARALELSKRTGIPVDTVERDPAAVEKQVATNDYDSLLKNNPKLGQWLSDPVNARVARDDHAGLSGVEAAYRKLAQKKTPSESADWEASVLPQPGGFVYGSMDKPSGDAPLLYSQLQTGIEQTASGWMSVEKIATIRALKEIDDIEKGVKPSAGFKSVYRSMSPEQRAQERQRLDARLTRLTGAVAQSEKYVSDLPVDPAVKSFTKAADEAGWESVIDVIGGAIDRVVRDLTSMRSLGDYMPEMERPKSEESASKFGKLVDAFFADPRGLIQHGIITNAPTVAMTTGAALIGGVPGAAIAGFAADFPSRLEDVIADRVRDQLASKDVGINLDDPQEVTRYLRDNPAIIDDAVKSAGLGSLTVGLTESFLNRVIKPLKADKGIARNVGVATVNTGSGVVTEMAGEAAARAAAGQEPSLSEVAMEGIGGVGMAAGHTVANTITERNEIRSAETQKQNAQKTLKAIIDAVDVLGTLRVDIANGTASKLDDFIAKVADTKLAGRSPDKLTEFLSGLSEDDNVFIPASVVQDYFQSKPIEDVQRMADALGITEQIPEAVARGGDVVIPLAKYVTEAGKSDAHKAWREDVRLEADGLSIRQAQEDAKTKAERLKMEVDRFEKQLEAGISEVDASTRVYEDIRDKLKSLGQYTNDAAEQQAALYASRYEARAARNPGSYADAWDAYQKAGTGKGLDIQTQLSERVGAYPPDELDVLLNSIRSGKVAPSKTDANANEQFTKDRTELKAALDSMGIDTGKLTNAQIRKAVKEEVEKRKAGRTLDQAFRPRESIEFTRRLDALKAGTLPRGEQLPLGPTPEALKLGGLPDLPLLLLQNEARKVVLEKHAGKMNEEALRRLPDLLRDPVMVYRQEDGRFGVMLDGNIVVAISQSAVVGTRRANLIVTVHPRTSPAVFLKAMEGGRVTYRHTVRSQSWFDQAREQSPGREPTTGFADQNIRTESDLGKTYDQEARGRISFTENRAIISLFQERDLSTLIHESGHLWLAELEFDAKDPNASEEVKKDWQTITEWLGSKDGYITREQHEMFARGFETYVMEGKAPSSALASAFRSFRRWLTQIYQRLSALDAPITPEIRDVFDRLLATDEQIEAAKSKQGLNPIFKDAKSAGMTKAEFDAYTARANAVVEEAEQRLLAKTMEGIRKQRTKEWKADEAQVREEVLKEVMADPGQQALMLLTKGTLPAGYATPEVLKGIKLAKEDIVALYGDESVLSMLPSGTYRDRASGPGVMSADELAPVVGVANGRELIERLMQLEAQRRAMAEKGDKRSVARAKVDEETAQRMKERYGDPLNDGTIEQEAMAAVHTDKQAALMSVELKALAKRAGNTGTISWDDIRNWAADAIAQKSVREGTKFEQYLRAERDAGKKVERALMKGNFVDAFKAKQDQLVNLALYTEAKKAAAQVESARKLMDRYANADTLKNMDQEYLEQIHQLLEAYEFRRRSDKLLSERKSFEEWAVEQDAKGFEVIPPPRLDRGLFTTNYRDLSVEEMLGLSDTVKQIAHLGRWKKEMLDGQKKREFEAVVNEAVDAMAKIPQRGVSNVRRGMTRMQERLGGLGHWLRSADSALVKLETIFEWLDGNSKGTGVFSRAIFNRMSEAQTRERDMQKDLNTKLTAIHDKVPLEQRKRWNEVLTLPELGQNLNRSQLIAVALNIGNESNLDKLLRGEKWDEQAVRTVLNKYLTKEEWGFVQDTWDLINSLWPEVEAMERRVNGVAPPKVEAIAVETPHGTLKGGYYPMVYDPAASVEGDKIGAMKAEGLFDPEYRRASTRAGATRKRTGAAYPVLLSLQVVGQHLNEISHDIAFREAVIDSYRFLTDKRIVEGVNAALGPEYAAQFQPWLKHIANEWAIDRKGVEGIEKFAGALRTNTTVVGMGFRITTMLSQTAGFANSIQRLGTIGMADGLRAFLKNPAQAIGFVHSRSGEMRNRMNDLERDIRQALLKIEGKTDFRSEAQRFAFRGIALFDHAVTIPTWIGAYNKALKEGRTDAEAAAYGDKMVRDTQGAGSAKDLAAVQRGGEMLKLFTMFYSYFNVLYNRQRTLVRDARAVRSVGEAMDVLAQSFWLLVVPQLLGQLLTGQGPDDDEDWGSWAARNIFFGLFSGLPWFRDAANTVNNMAGGKGNYGGAKLSPVQGVWDTLIHTGKDVASLINGDDTSETGIKYAFNSVGLILGLPTGQVGTTSQFLWDALVSGSQNPDGLKEWMSGLVYGPERKK